ncbi:TatD family hydrolase [Thorsellia anophelis]|uniref:TatD DNase family protein n=1 Tax=Thorsellia anophelis DSM 18579 TaxID=1123402 RepID=A0A1I0E1P6_9GAMM|nr:TatD family hydrolase [Thorsellia anophelis]SET38811.1 TatD DNase family protein [Thorsellia anophelis DSM 18579]
MIGISKYQFYDTHAHLDFEPFTDDMPRTIDLFLNAGIKQVMIPAVTRDKFDRLINISASNPNVYTIALGLHPLYIQSHTLSDLDYLETLLCTKDNSQIKAIGEIGLDAFLMHLSEEKLFKKQIDFLQKQLEMANRYNLPVILHSRRTHHVLLSILKKITVHRGGVIHGFSGSLEQALEFIKLGYKIGVGGIITYPRANKSRLAISKLPLESLLLETDSPDMPVYGRQGKVNRSECLIEIFQALCTLREEPAKVIAEQIWETSNTLFH